jgi:signal peptidase II
MRWKLLFVVIGILIVDVVSKGMTHFYFKPSEFAPYFFPFGGMAVFQGFGIDFCIRHVTNTGIAWGLGSSFQDFILLLRMAITAGVIFYMKRSSQKYALALIVAGGLGNIVDYFVYGHVIDMFHFILWGYSYPVFNIADTSIFLGIVALLWKGWKNSRRPDVIPESN